MRRADLTEERLSQRYGGSPILSVLIGMQRLEGKRQSNRIYV